MALDPSRTSTYLKLLPSIFSEDPFLGRFLLAFEHVLTGLPLPEFTGREPEPAEGIEETIDGISAFFDPTRTRSDFLPWLAEWVALSLRADLIDPSLDDPNQVIRRFLAGIVPLYRSRGTKTYLAELLRIYTGLSPVISGVEETDFQIRDHSTIGVDTQLGGAPPHRFKVILRLPQVDEKTLERQGLIARALIDSQKPAHTTYELQIDHGTIQIGVRSTIGTDTLLGSVSVP